jgi:hypothetical protein
LEIRNVSLCGWVWLGWRIENFSKSQGLRGSENLRLAICSDLGDAPAGHGPTFSIMKPFIQILAILLVLLSATLLVPDARESIPQIAMASLVLAVLLLIASFASGGREAPVPKPAAAEAVKPAPAPATPKPQTHVEAVTVLGMFQEKGRLVDFLMDDITPYSDEQVGSVVRAVHQGCRAALQEHFSIEPVAAQSEGTDITVPAGYAVDEFRLVGNLRGAAPFKGVLVHKGWKVKSVKLPRALHADENRLPAIAPAEVEVR